MTFRIIEKQPRRHKKDREIYLKGSTIAITGRKDKRAATLLMRQALLEGCSVIVAGDAPGYPVTMPSSCIFMRFDAELLKGAIAPPWIRGLTNMALNAREDVLRTKMRLPAFTGTGRLLPDPTDRPCYYEIDLSTPSRHGAKKGGLFAEALLASLMEQYSTNDGAVDTVLFLEVPYKPVSLACMDAIKKAGEHELDIVFLYDLAPECGSRYLIRSDNEGAYGMAQGKSELGIEIPIATAG